MSNLGRLVKISLREVWENEASDFTPWLSDEQNLRLLGESLGLDLELIQREKNVGPFSADILCKNVSDDTWILIENQLEKTDHKHLGQLLTYAAGLDAVTIIWIAETFTDEHRAAIDWLNKITGEQFSFFAIEIELWKIGDSSVAPKFNIVSKPNDWVKNVQTAAKSNQELSNHKQLQQLFWSQFKDYMSKNSRITCQKPSPKQWMNHSIGRSGVHLSSIISASSSDSKSYIPEVRVELYLNSESAKKHFAQLIDNKNEIENSLGKDIVWYNPESNKSSKIYIKKNIDFFDEANWQECFQWLKANLEKFSLTFTPLVKKFD